MSDVQFYDLFPNVDADEPPAPIRRKTKRSSKACLLCRTRKVRCDVATRGIPCSNCDHDEVDCVIPESKRQPKYAGKMGEIQLHRGKASPSSASSQDGRAHQRSQPQTLRTAPTPYSAHEGHLSITETSPAQASTTPPSSLAPLLPVFFPLANCSRTNLDRLELQRATALPPDHIRTALVTAYLEYADGLFPVIDTQHILSVVQGGPLPGRKIHLILFQAIIFVGAIYVEMDILNEAGYPSRTAALEAFSSKVNHLYNHDTCNDPVSVIQSLLLVATADCHPFPKGRSQWSWLGLATTLAYHIGLNRAERSHRLPPYQKHLERRLWWSLVILDRTVALGGIDSLAAHAPFRILDEDSNQPMVSDDDFTLDDGGMSGDGEGDSASIWNERARLRSPRARQYRALFIERARLSWLVEGQTTRSPHD